MSENWRERTDKGNKNWRKKDGEDSIRWKMNDGGSNMGIWRKRPESLGKRNDNEKKTHRPNYSFQNRRKVMSKRDLVGLLQGDRASEILLQIVASNGPFLALMKQSNIPEEIMCQVLAVLVKASTSPTENQRILLSGFFMELLPQTVTSEHFLIRHLHWFINQLNRTTAHTYPNRHLFTKAVLDLLMFLRALQATLPTASIDTIRDIVQLLQPQIDYLNRKGDCFKQEVVELLNEVIETMNTITPAKEVKQIDGASHEQPPEDFRSIGICPTYDDIFTNHRPFVRPNVIDGKYIGGVNHYLDVQFRLLREDFVRPLREGIQECTNQIRNEQASWRNSVQDIRIYQNVRILSSSFEPDDGDLIFNATFDVSRLRNVQWMVIFRQYLCDIRSIQVITPLFSSYLYSPVSDCSRAL